MTPHIDKAALNEKLALIHNTAEIITEVKAPNEINYTLHKGIMNYFLKKGFKHQRSYTPIDAVIFLGYGGMDIQIQATRSKQTVAIYFKDPLSGETHRRMIGNWEFPNDVSLVRVKASFKTQLAHIVKKAEDGMVTLKKLNK